MAVVGDSIEAFLRLDASNFTGNIENAISSVETFKGAMIDVGAEGDTLSVGIKQVSSALNTMVRDLTLIEEIDTKVINKFKQLGLALNNIAQATQRFGSELRRGGNGLQALESIIQVFESGVASAEVQLKLTNAQITQLAENSRRTSSTMRALTQEEQVLRSQFQLLESTLSNNALRSEEVRAITQRLRTEYGLSGQKLAEVRSQLMQTIQATQQYSSALNQPITPMERWINVTNTLSVSYGKVTTTMQRWKTLTDSIVNSTAQKLGTVIERISSTLGNLSTSFNSVSSSTTNASNGLRRFTSAVNSTDGTIARANTGVRQYAHALTIPTKYMREGGAEAQKYRVLQKGVNLTIEDNINTIRRQSVEMQKNAVEKLRSMGYTGRLSAEEQKLSLSKEKVSASSNKQSASLNRATNSMNRQATAARGLGRALSSLRMIGTMVASMMVYNFAHNLITATRETVNAKSEMEGYFKMLHLGQNEVKDFNDTLTQTVQRFQRVNKYSLGETVSSIGVEFNLTTEEMKKALTVTSMVTSEYLRAGRNANEASLAVKDVLQGQFQRLSRETGVKGEQLKEAGWSGDNTDVLSLMTALEKVGESRNWDVFAEKANSLNDIVTILQNRFGEWSAEMVYQVQPSIVNAFNAIMSVMGFFGASMGRVWEWLNSDGIVQNIVKWGGLATAITGVTTALISYRTGANLVQIVQMGLRGSIVATVFQLKAEEVATYGTRNAIVAKITSLKAEQVANIGVKNAIMTKVLGLNAEKVAQFNLKGAIVATSFAKEYEKAVQEGANVTDLESIALKYKDIEARLTTRQAILMHILGLKAETVAKKGTIVALAERIAQTPLYIGSLKAEEVAELSTAEAAWVLMGSLLPLVAIFAALAFAVYSVIKPMQDASEEMKAFNTLVNDGDNIIKANKKTLDSLTKSEEALTQKRDEATKGTMAYKRANDELLAVKQDVDTADKNYKNSVKAVEMARSSQLKFEQEQTKILTHNQTELANSLIKVGVASKDAYEVTSHELNEAENGAKQLREALQMIAFESDKFKKKMSGDGENKGLVKMLDDYGASDERIKEFGKNMYEAEVKIQSGMERFLTSDDLMDRIGGWLELQQGRLEEWWTELNAFFEVRDWNSIRDKLFEGIKYVLTGFGAFDWISWIGNSIGEKGIVGTIMDALFGEGDSDGILDIINEWGTNMILIPIRDWIKWFMEDPSAHYGEMTEDWSLGLAKFLFGKNETTPIYDMVWGWIDDNIINPINDTILGIPDAIMDWVGNTTLDWSKAIGKLLFGERGVSSEAESMSFGDIKKFFGDAFNNYIAKPLGEWVTGLMTDPLGTLNIQLPQFDIGSLITGLFNNSSGESTSVDTESGVTKTISDRLVHEFTTWITNFNANPFEALGVQLPQIDILGLISSLIPTGGDGGFNIGGWLSSLFDISGIVSSFTTGLNTIFTTASTIASSVSVVFQNLKNVIWGHITGLVNNVRTGFENAKSYAVTKITAMRDSVSNVIHQMTDAWTKMKDSILNSAKLIYDGVKKKFDDVKNTLSDFFTKLQNPSKWGSAGQRSWSKSPRPQVARRLFSNVMPSRGSGAGINPYSSPKQKVKLEDLVQVVGGNQQVTLSDFLSMFSEGGFGSWSFHKPSKKHIFNTGKQWKSGPPVIQGIGSVGDGYKVDRFWNGKPTFKWEEFLAVAEAIFSQIPYKFYYDSEWKGSWLGALLSGALNCSDGSEALIALASVFGFGGGYKVHTTTKDGTGHFFARINGHNLDTTHFQNSGSWTPLGGAGTGGGRVSNRTVNVNVEISGPVYGVDDLDSKIQESVQKGIQAEFNDPYTVAI